MPSPHTLLCEAIAVLTSWVMVSFQHDRIAEYPIHLKCAALTTTTRQIWREEHTYPSVSPFFSVSGPCNPSLSCGDDAPFFPSCWLPEGTWSVLERISNELGRPGGGTGPAPTPKAALSGSAFPPHLHLHPVILLPQPCFSQSPGSLELHNIPVRISSCFAGERNCDSFRENPKAGFSRGCCGQRMIS